MLRPFFLWMGFKPQSEASLRTLSLQVCFLVVLAEDESLRLSFPIPGCGDMSASTTLAPCLRLSLVPYPRSFRMGLEPLSEAPLRTLQLPAHFFLAVLGLATCLQGYWISPLFFPDHRDDSRTTCTALPPVRRLSFVLGNFSLWLGFGLCLKILFAPCGCRRAYCGPHCGRESARVLASLFGSSPSGVRHLSRVCSSV